MSNFEDDFWNDWTKCPQCKLSDPVRLAASNAWHRQQSKYDALLAEKNKLEHQFNCSPDPRIFDDAIKFRETAQDKISSLEHEIVGFQKAIREVWKERDEILAENKELHADIDKLESAICMGCDELLAQAEAMTSTLKDIQGNGESHWCSWKAEQALEAWQKFKEQK